MRLISLSAASGANFASGLSSGRALRRPEEGALQTRLGYAGRQRDYWSFAVFAVLPGIFSELGVVFRRNPESRLVQRAKKQQNNRCSVAVFRCFHKYRTVEIEKIVLNL